VLALILSLWTLNNIDAMKIQSVIPMGFALALMVSAVMVRSRDLMMPLWMGRQYLKWGGVGILALIFVGYSTLQRGFYGDDQRKMFMNL